LENPTDIGEPPVEVAGVAPTVVVEVKEGSSVEFVEARASVEKKKGDQAEGTGSEPVLKSAEKELGDQAVGIVHETVHEIVVDKSGTEPDLMEAE